MVHGNISLVGASVFAATLISHGANVSIAIIKPASVELDSSRPLSDSFVPSMMMYNYNRTNWKHSSSFIDCLACRLASLGFDLQVFFFFFPGDEPTGKGVTLYNIPMKYRIEISADKTN